MKSLILAGLLLLCGSPAYAIPDNPAGIDFGSIQCTGIYRLGQYFEYDCTTGGMFISSGTITVSTITANYIVFKTLISTDGFSVTDLFAELSISTQTLATDKMDRNGLLNQGLLTNFQIQSLVCPSITRGACWVTSSDEGDRYDSQSDAPGDYRNGRTGKAP